MENKNTDEQEPLSPTRISENFLHCLLASVTDGLLVTDKDDTIVLANKAAEQLFETPVTDLINTTFQDLLAEHALNISIEERVERSGEVQRFDFEISAHALPSPRIIHAISFPISDQSGTDIKKTVTLFHDITREHELERLKTEFVNTAAHELRTPLTSIRGFSELLLERTFSEEEQKKFLLYINQQSKQLTHIINDYLDATKAQGDYGFSASRHQKKTEKS